MGNAESVPVREEERKEPAVKQEEAPQSEAVTRGEGEVAASSASGSGHFPVS